MRRVACLSLCLGLGLALTGTARAQHGAPVSNTQAVRLPAGPLCPKCVAKMEKRVPADPRDVAMAQGGDSGLMMAQAHEGSHAGCAVCEGSGTGVAYVGGQPDAAGYATVGGGGEPAPIGVMHASRGQQATPYAQPATAGRAASPMVPPPMGQSMSYPGFHRRPLLGHVLGLPTMSGFGQASKERRRQMHAAIRYDEGVSQVSHLPASMVYGR